MRNRLSYRPDIDGLRAVAVLAVIAAHLPEKYLPSGFLGVDVFFAISGYVVTGSIFGQQRTELGQLYLGFLARRVRRLLPALSVLVAVTGSVVLATDPFPRHSVETGLAALFGFANIALYFFELDYFSPSSIFNAFTHTWSLGVEEQFYVVFPMFAWIFYFRTGRKSRRPLAIATICGGLFSVTVFALLYEDHRPAAFFMMPARIWELGLGAVVFLVSQRTKGECWQRVLRPLAPFVLAGLLACFLVPENEAMPATILVVALSGLLLATDDRSLAARLLKLPPVVYTGKISYSLYLWHWPIIALGPIVLEPSLRFSALYVVATAIAAVLSFHLVEKPLRYRTWTKHNGGDIGLGIAGNLVVAAALMLTMWSTAVTPQSETAALHPPPYLPLLNSGKSHVMTCALDGGSRKFQPDTIDNCTVPPQQGMPAVWAMGDSHSGHLQGMLYELHERIGVGVHLVETPGFPFPFEEGKTFAPRQLVFSNIFPLFKAGDIVLISRIYLSRTPPYEANDLGAWLDKVAALADALEWQDVHLVLTGPPPIFPFADVRECSIAERQRCAVERGGFAHSIDQVRGQLAAFEAEHESVHVFDLFDSVCPPSESYCYPDDGTSYLFRDMDHFNSLGSQRLAEPFTEFLRTENLIAPVR